MLGRKYTILAPIALVAAFGLAACEGDTGPQGPAGADGQDANALETLNVNFSRGGTWAVTPRNTSGEAVTALSYDADEDAWTVTVAAGEFVLPFDDGGTYVTECTPGEGNPCATFTPYVDGVEPIVDQYGTFATVTTNDTITETIGYTHYGFSTVDMPTTGTASYVGVFEGTFDDGVGTDSLTGAVTVDADFGAVIDQVVFASEGTGEVPDSTYLLGGTATIAGNDYSGDLTTAEYFDGDATTTDLTITADDTFDGTFYGNDAVETAGVVDAIEGTDSITGGFWAVDDGGVVE